MLYCDLCIEDLRLYFYVARILFIGASLCLKVAKNVYDNNSKCAPIGSIFYL